jgi:hypothetical protein
LLDISCYLPIFYSGIVVLYLLALSWIIVIASLPSCHRFKDRATVIKLWSIVQSYIFFAFTFVLLVKAKHFGSSPECNRNAVVVLFRPFSALHGGRILGWIVTAGIAILYTAVTCIEYVLPPCKRVWRLVLKEWAKEGEAPTSALSPTFDAEAVSEPERVLPDERSRSRFQVSQ